MPLSENYNGYHHFDLYDIFSVLVLIVVCQLGKITGSFLPTKIFEMLNIHGILNINWNGI